MAETALPRALVLGDKSYGYALQGMYACVYPKELHGPINLDLIGQMDLIMFTGGVTDVTPSLYNDNCHPNTEPDIERDREEAVVFDMALEANIPMVGICRGAQLVTVLSGGSLIQDITGHGGVGTVRHPMHTHNGMKIEVTSSHHQMMYPWDIPHVLLGWSYDISSAYENGDGHDLYGAAVRDHKIVREPEMVWYPATRSLAVQYHPEWMNPDEQGYEYFQSQLKDCLNGSD